MHKCSGNCIACECGLTPLYHPCCAERLLQGQRQPLFKGLLLVMHHPTSCFISLVPHPPTSCPLSFCLLPVPHVCQTILGLGCCCGNGTTADPGGLLLLETAPKHWVPYGACVAYSEAPLCRILSVPQPQSCMCPSISHTCHVMFELQLLVCVHVSSVVCMMQSFKRTCVVRELCGCTAGVHCSNSLSTWLSLCSWFSVLSIIVA